MWPRLCICTYPVFPSNCAHTSPILYPHLDCSKPLCSLWEAIFFCVSNICLVLIFYCVLLCCCYFLFPLIATPHCLLLPFYYSLVCVAYVKVIVGCGLLFNFFFSEAKKNGRGKSLLITPWLIHKFYSL